MAPGYVFAETKPPEAKHVRGKIGAAPRVELIRLYKRRDVGHMPPDAFKPGDQVEIQRGPWAKLTGFIIEKRGRKGWWVNVAIFGTMTKTHLADNYMRKYDPG